MKSTINLSVPDPVAKFADAFRNGTIVKGEGSGAYYLIVEARNGEKIAVMICDESTGGVQPRCDLGYFTAVPVGTKITLEQV